MTCEELQLRLEAYCDGALPELKARAIEQHAAECVACYARLDAASRPRTISRRLTPPPALRQSTLAAVKRARRVRMLRRAAVGATSIAAVALIALMLRPAVKSASDFPGAIKSVVAMDRARAQFTSLDLAENEVEDALREQPDDQDLIDALERIRHQRDELSRMVREAGS